MCEQITSRNNTTYIAVQDNNIVMVYGYSLATNGVEHVCYSLATQILQIKTLLFMLPTLRIGTSM